MNDRLDQKYKRRADYLLAIAIFALVLFGLIAIYSVSKYYSLQITNNATDKFYLERQLMWVVVGCIAWIVTQSVDYRFWQKNSRYMLAATIVLLIIPILIGSSSDSSAVRWISIAGLNFQPAELAKLTLIIYLSGWFTKRSEENSIAKSGPFFLVLMAIVSILMLVQKDLGTLAVIIGIAGAMYLMSGAPAIHMLIGGGLAGVLLWLAIKIEPYRLARITAFINPEKDLLGSGYHIQNALIAIGSGGLWGLGFGQSKQKYLYLPEAHTDSIFAIISEELGFLRASIIILVIGFVAFRGFRIARLAPDTFSRLMAVGITTWLIWQSFINIAAMLSLIPLTGVPLPFISYGGSSLLILLAATGILLNISKYCKRY
jgi:cell division protein FtsW